MSPKHRLMCAAGLGLLATGGSAGLVVHGSEDAQWRLRVVGAKLAGSLPEIPAGNLARWLLPGSPVYLRPLAETPNVRASVRNLLSGSDHVGAGARLFETACMPCHVNEAHGQAAPNLATGITRSTDWDFFSTVKWGRAGTAMLPQALSDLEIWQTHLYVRSLAGDDPAAGLDASSGARRRVLVDAAAIVASGERPEEWLTYGGNYFGHRHSLLAEIAPENLDELRVAWAAQLRGTAAPLTATPIVAQGLIFVTESPEGVVALDARSGEQAWQFRWPLSSYLSLCCGSANRGVAVLGDSVFVATLDAHLLALDAATGRLKWAVKVAEPRDGYSMTGAPLAFRDTVVVGVAGGEFGIHGFLAAFSASDGGLLWKFNTVPQPGEHGHDSWGGDSWETGGGPTWATGTYDDELGLIYWGVGNPAPVHNPEARPGDNLYTNSVLALDAETGSRRWHFQFTPNDAHDRDAIELPVLAEIPWQGRARQVLLQANRNGFFYALDRVDGEFLFAEPYVTQTWALAIEPSGRPVPNPEAAPRREGSLVWPGVAGGTNWWPPSYDRARRLFFVPAIDAAAFFFKEPAELGESRMFMGGAARTATGQPSYAFIKALDANTGTIRWETKLDSMLVGSHSVGGVLSTAPGLMFAGYGDQFYALDSDDGRILWRIRLGGRVAAAPVSFAVGGKQFVAVLAGHSLFAFALPENSQ